MFLKSSLGRLELSFYAAVWIVANVYSLCQLFIQQEKLIRGGYVYLEDLWELKLGFSFINRFQDHTDIEFPMWHQHFVSSVTFLLAHSAFAEILRSLKLRYNLIPIYNTLFTSCYIVYMFNYQMLLMFLALPILYFATFSIIGKRKSSIWIMSIAIMMFINILKDSNLFYEVVIDDLGMTEMDSYLILVTLNWIQLRCMTACLDSNEKYNETMKNKVEFITKMLGHSFYFPTLFMGPNILYKNYEQSLNASNHSDLKSRLGIFAKNMAYFMFYYFCIALYLHYIYFFAMQSRLEYLQMLPTVALYGGGIWMGLHFYMKYLVSYGVSSSFATLDHIDAPPTPRCILRVHLYSDMWKHFDVGLYRFLIEYIYKPVLKKLKHYQVPDVLKTLFTSFLCFSFILLWHGMTKSILLWIVLNFIGIAAEKCSQAFSKTERYLKFRRDVLKTEQNHDRFRALICLPLLIMSAFSNFFLFTDYEVGMVYIKRFLYDSYVHIFCVCFALYSGANVAIAIRDVGSKCFYDNLKTKLITDAQKIE